jgi:uncharacterized protein YndB with AHSA1/START domain
MMTSTQTDRIEKKITLRAPRSKIWRAISDSQQFGEWFQVKLEGAFVVGQWTKGSLTFPGHEGKPMAIEIVTIRPETYFAYRWHPNAHDPAVDYSPEPTTLVEFHLEEADGATLLTVVESGFDQLPDGRRASAFKSNDGGWAFQILAIQRYVESR